ncbi:FecR domain-containing protein [Pseudomonas sp. S9]|uniref:FecR domain-containing protein n=1 Tax=Pseudomonas sp. S9 TaxID=686578 RepID=UPI0002556E88|nr:FecR domain-containing protein [Pseudomonas sp. S9]
MSAQSDFRVLEQAAEWFAVLASESVSDRQRKAWQLWLASNPAHQAAWHRVQQISGQFQALPAAQREPAHNALRAGVRTRRQVLSSLLLLVGGAGLGLTVSRKPVQAWMADQSSTTGQIRQLHLADGAQLWLNSNSSVDIDYSLDLRLLRLWQGELLVDSAPDIQQPARPLCVDTVDGRLQALGTRFSVRMQQAGTLLSVFEGRVRITCAQGASKVVGAGQQAWFDRRQIGPISQVSPARNAWQRGMLLADDRALGDFISELAEHVPGHLAVDPRIAGLHLVGAFPLNDPERIYAALEASLPIRVNRRWPWWITLEPVSG